MMRITIRAGSDWGCDYTAEDAQAYKEAVEDMVESTYPGAICEYVMEKELAGPMKITIEGCNYSEHDEIKEFVEQVPQTIWIENEFWTEQ